MSEIVKVKRGDKRPVTWTVPVDLTGCSVRLLAKRGSNPTVVLASSITNYVGGEVTHVTDGTLAIGMYQVELEITFPNGNIITAPTETYENLQIIPDLG